MEVGRGLDPRKPWPTSIQESQRILKLIAGVAFLQFGLNGLNNVLTGWWMLGIWVAVGAAVALFTTQIEKYFMKRGRQ